MTRFRRRRRSCQAAKHLWVGAWSLWSRGNRMGLPAFGRSVRIGNRGNWNILVPLGKEINRDAVSKGDRTRHKANRIPNRNIREMWSCRPGYFFPC